MRIRYRDEIRELLDHSRRPVRDRLDIVLAAAGMRLGGWIAALRLIGVVGAGVCLAGLVYAIADLRGGAVEVLDHWWSTVALGCSVLSIASLAVLWVAEARARSWNGSG